MNAYRRENGKQAGCLAELPMQKLMVLRWVHGFLNKPDSDMLMCFTTRDLESSFRYNNLPAGSLCKTKYYCGEAKINEVYSFCTQGGFSLAGKSRLLARKYSVTPRKNIDFSDRWVGFQQKLTDKDLWEKRGIISVATINVLHSTRCYHILSHWILKLCKVTVVHLIS